MKESVNMIMPAVHKYLKKNPDIFIQLSGNAQV